MRPIVLIFAMITYYSFGQNFTNADLEGTVGMSTTPAGWFAVSFSDTVCQAYNNAAATPDVTGEIGPVPAIGISGTPFSGATFVSGLISGDVGTHHHEGIRQTVTGFTPGKPYTIHFYQAVVKQNNQLDSSGSWSIYVDNEFAGTSLPSSSPLVFDAQGLQWEERSIGFTATQSNHCFKFLPCDDDPSQIVPQESLRMGIDYINIIPDSSHIFHDTICAGEMATIWAEGANQYQWVPLNDTNFVLSLDSVLHISPDSTSHYLCINNLDTSLATVTVLYPPTVNLGTDHYLCAGDTATIQPDVHHADSHLWDDDSNGTNMITNLGGVHWMIAQNTCGTAVDSVGIHLDSIQLVDLSFDSIACKHEPITLSPHYPNAQYLWENGSEAQELTAETSGTYYLDISNHCGSSSHAFTVDYEECYATIQMPNVFSPQGDGMNDTFRPITIENIIDFEMLIFNRWGEVVFQSNNKANGWNGEIHNQPASEGTYFWKVVYSTPQGDNNEAQGSLSLVR